MSGIPELDRLICCWPNQHDMAQCALVCKKWHEAVIPHLWSDLSCIGTLVEAEERHRQSKAFCRLVLEDYQQQQNHHNTKPPIQPSWSSSLPAP
ncbi:hypothetical protein B0O80DRAFT_466725 [Mortierella sp. GBAus27b]|nr:hypothetical protein B0O80DRAFT_466725 [Mortierella sp. GBAus27b]